MSQQEFVNSRFTHIVEGFREDVNPYLECPEGMPTANPVNLASRLLAEAQFQANDGHRQSLFSKIQLPANKSGTWYFQGNRATAGEARA